MELTWAKVKNWMATHKQWLILKMSCGYVKIKFQKSGTNVGKEN